MPVVAPPRSTPPAPVVRKPSPPAPTQPAPTPPPKVLTPQPTPPPTPQPIITPVPMASLLAVPPTPSPVPPPQPAIQQVASVVSQPDIVTPKVQQHHTPTPTTQPQSSAHQPLDEIKSNIAQNQAPVQQQQQLPQQPPAVTTTVPLSQPSPSIPTTAPNVPHQQNIHQNNNQRQIHNQNQNPVVQQNGIKKQPELQQQHLQQSQQQYLDPLEHSLASLEQSFKSEMPPNSLMNAVAQNNLLNDFTLGLAKQNSMDLGHAHLMAQLQGLGPDMAGLMNNTNKSDGFLPSHNGYMKQESLHDPTQLSASLSNALGMGPVMPPVSSIFDPLPTIPVSHQSLIQQAPLMMPASTIMPPMHLKEEKPMITPKPIEDLIGIPNMNNSVNERVKYEEKKNSSSNQRQEDKPMSNSFYQAFKPKQEQNVKNATSWSLLAQAGSPQGSNVQVAQQSKPKPTMDSFQVSLNHLLHVFICK